MAENGKISVPRQRWKLLAQVITRQPQFDTTENSVSVRRFNNFGLLEVKVHNDDIGKDSNSLWLEYSSKSLCNFSALIRQFQGNVSLDTLLGFNNTGNVCIWPSEEVMTYFCLKNKDKFSGKSVCELGGGMTCLAGVIVSIVTDAYEVLLTDGNESSVTNLSAIVERNRESIGSTKLSTRILRWGEDVEIDDIQSKFDYILCADCLFFDEGREDLLSIVYAMLKPAGQAVMFAPTRGNTFQEFTNLAEKIFEVKVLENYDEHVWKLHQKLKMRGKDVYDENLHYPQMLILKKRDTRHV